MDRRKKGEYIGALGALLVHVAVIALLILVSFTVPQPDEDAGGIPVMTVSYTHLTLPTKA